MKETLVDELYRETEAHLYSIGEVSNEPPPPDTFPEVETTSQNTPTKRTSWTVRELLSTDFPEPGWAVKDLIPVGLSFLAGRPKIGKSWLALQLAHAKGTGGQFLGKSVERGGVLFIALEDSPRRLKERIIKQRVPGDADITFETEWRKLTQGGIEDLTVAVASERYKLIVIDTISRALGKADQLDLSQMTEIIGTLQTMSQKHNIVIFPLDHHRKSSGYENSPIDDLMGSTGKAATADSLLGLYREKGKHGAILKITGRDVEEQDLALTWDGLLYCWQCSGDAYKVRIDMLKADIMKAIEEICIIGLLPTTTRIAKQINRDEGNISKALAELVTAGNVRKGNKVGREVPYYLVEGQQ